jgi:proteasome lid subunit RPN8/RPN11
VSLKISSELLDRIRAHGRSTYPEECCGLLLGEADGTAKSVRYLRAMRNTREDSPKNRYLIDPRELLEAEREARARKLDIVGVYHSHPDHPARPSEFDREHAFPWYSYIVVRVASGEPGELTSWVLLDDRSAFDAEEIEIL